jgi:hypothetical protein
MRAALIARKMLGRFCAAWLLLAAASMPATAQPRYGSRKRRAFSRYGSRNRTGTFFSTRKQGEQNKESNNQGVCNTSRLRRMRGGHAGYCRNAVFSR